MKEETAELLRALASKERHRVIGLLVKGVRHPADLGRHLGVSRQSVDRHLLLLQRWGIVEREAVSPPMGRPRVEYRVTSEARDLMDALDEEAMEYHNRVLERYRRLLQDLDSRLAYGQLEEREYLGRVRELRKRYSAFL